MPVKFTLVRRVDRVGGSSFVASEELSCDSCQEFPDKGLPIGLSQYAVAFALNSLRVAVVTCDKAVTIKTNDPESPGDVIPIAAKKVFTWDVLSGTPIPFKNDVTSIYVDAPGGGRLTVVLGTDPAVSGPSAPGPATFEIAEEE